MKRLISTFIVILILLFQAIPAFCATSPEVEAQAYILMDSKSGRVLYEYNADTPWRPASTTKIMTALVALKNAPLDQVMTASHDAITDIGVGGMNIGIMADEQMTLNDLLHALLIVSANESANIIAENTFASKQEFIDEMNKTAKQLGAVNTHFTNPNGIDETERDKDMFTTARDLAIIARECMTDPVFRTIVSNNQLTTLSPTNKHSSWPVLNNTSKILGKTFTYGNAQDNSKEFTIIGVKTGSTMRAGSNYVSCAVNKEGQELISVILGVKSQPGKDVFKFTENLIRAGFENFSSQMIIDRNAYIDSITVADAADDGKIDLVTKNTIDAMLPNDRSLWNLEKKVSIKQDVVAPIKKGDILGTIEYTENGITIGKSDIVSTRTVDMSFKAKANDFIGDLLKNKLFKLCFIVICVIIVFLIIRFILRRISRRRRYLLSRKSTYKRWKNNR